MKVYDVGEYHGVPDIIMEYIEGKTLAQALKEAPRLAPPEAIGIGCQLAQALATAHKQGIVHRDIKPANIMIVRDTKTIKVTDFGVCRFEASELTQATREGDVIGTPRYMSPEQVMGRKADSRSDVFSTGIVLYQMLSGRTPFAGDTAASVQIQIAKVEPKPLKKLVPDLPMGVCRAIERALMKDPERRYRNGEELAAALIDVQKALDKHARRGKRARRIPLSAQWAAITGVLLAVPLTLAIAFVAARQRAELFDQATRQGASFARFMASQSAGPLLREQWAELEILVHKSLNEKDFAYLVVADRTWTVRGSSISSQVGAPYEPPTGESILELADGVSVLRTTTAAGRNLLHVAAPISEKEAGVGTVYVGIDEAKLRGVLRPALGALLALVVGTNAAGVVGSIVLMRRLLQDIRAVGAGLGDIAAGRYHARVSDARRDELGDVCRQFNATARTLQSRHEPPPTG